MYPGFSGVPKNLDSGVKQLFLQTLSCTCRTGEGSKLYDETLAGNGSMDKELVSGLC